MADRTATRMDQLVQSDIRRLTVECNKVGGFNLGQGICDLPTHPLVKQGAIDAIKNDAAIYTHARGLPELRSALARKLADHNKIDINPKTELCVTVGSSGAFSASVFATLNPGDEVILIEPFYGYHLNTLLMAGITPRFAQIDTATMELDTSSLESLINEKTRGIVVCTPGNPSGKVFTRQELTHIGELAIKHDLLIYSDEIYEYITYDGHEHVSPASLAGLKNNVITLGGYSKTFSITGWRIGYVAAPADIMDKIAVASDLLAVCAPHPLQRGVLEGLRADPAYYESMRLDYEKGRDMICDALESVKFKPVRPQGSYYVLADFSDIGWSNDQEAARELLARTKVAAIPGGAFFEPESGRGSKLLRFCYAKELPVLEQACNAIRTL
ncbi:pyridoxal phosphate-dependent aminotransferase [Planctomycetota bacterium]|nr:pyridoxal phosphate-dependent aminotransferase [Planctomycetota bacterium]